MSFAVRTARRPWSAAPSGLSIAVSDLLGTDIAAAETCDGGFSRGIAARLLGVDGFHAFVKAVEISDDSFASALYEREARIAGQLPTGLPAPRFLGTVRADGWLGLVFVAAAGTMPELPWHKEDLAAVIPVVNSLTEQLTPAPLALDRWAGDPAEWQGWQALDGGDGLPNWTPADWTSRMRELTGLEQACKHALAGNTLLHSDLRADNILIGASDVVLVDWAQAAVGPAWIDPLILALCAAAQGTPDPQPLFETQPASRSAEPEAVDAVLAMLAGRFVAASAAPGPRPIRVFQQREAVACMNWLASRRGWQTP